MSFVATAADRDAVGRAILDAWRPPPDLTVSAWADRYGLIPPGMSGQGGTSRWRTRPPQRALLDAFSHPRVRGVRCQKSARVGWTSVLQLVIGYWCHQDPRSILAVQPTEGDAKEWSKDVLDQVIAETDALRPLFEDPALRSESTILQKFFRGGLSIRLKGAQTGTGFRRFTVGAVLLDEVDAYPQSSGDEGDPIKLAEKRAETVWNAVIGIGSTPLLAGLSRIERLMEGASVGWYLVPCPHCGLEHVRRFRQPEQPLIVAGEIIPIAHLSWPDGEPELAAYVCPGCGALIGHEYHATMMAAGHWRGEDWTWRADTGFDFAETFDGVIGFRIWAGYNATSASTPPALAREWLDSKGNPEQRQVFVNTVLGEAYEDLGQQPASYVLRQRCEDWGDELPVSPDFLTCFVDVQGDWFELEAVAWMATTRESWSIAHLIIPGGPEDPESWNDLKEALAMTFETPAGRRRLDAVGIDTGYKQDEVMTFIRGHGGGKTLPFKGIGGKRDIVESLADRLLRLKQLRFRGDHVRPVLLGVDTGKAAVYRALAIEQEGPGYCHFPTGRSDLYFDSLTAEKAIIRWSKGWPIREWHKMRERNEVLDCRVGCLALCILMEQGVIPVLPPIDDRPSPSPIVVPPVGLGRSGWNLGGRAAG